jgi:regulation of enolase protein 1 (concanavalin A-like superfamily)
MGKPPVEKNIQEAYTASMKKIMMRDFRWLGKPGIWKKDYRETTLVVEGKTELPSCPLLLAVSDEDFFCQLLVDIAPTGGESGVCIYHSDLSYCAAGMSLDTLTIHTSVRGFKTTSNTASTEKAKQILWQLDRNAESFSISYATDLENPQFIEIVQSSLPGMQRAISFGPYFSNSLAKSFESGFHAVRYTKKEVQEHFPL